MAIIPQNSSSEPFSQSDLKSQTSEFERHSPDVQLNSPSEQEDAKTNNAVKRPNTIELYYRIRR